MIEPLVVNKIGVADHLLPVRDISYDAGDLFAGKFALTQFLLVLVRHFQTIILEH